MAVGKAKFAAQVLPIRLSVRKRSGIESMPESTSSIRTVSVPGGKDVSCKGPCRGFVPEKVCAASCTVHLDTSSSNQCTVQALSWALL